jgi:hypothetical protein
VHALTPAQIQQLLAGQSDRALCLCLIGSEREISFVRAHVSRTKAERLEEDLLRLRGQFEDGLLEVEEIEKARKTVEQAARKLSEKADKETRMSGRRDPQHD